MKAKMDFRMALVAVFLSSSCLFWAPSLLANTNFNDTNLWTTVSSGAGFVATPNGSQLDITVPTVSNGHAGVVSNFTISGDFDMQVSYSLVNWPTTDGIDVGLEFSKTDGSLIAGVGRTDLSGDAYGTEIPGYLAPITEATSDTSGKLRITRVGNTITTYYWLSGAWENFGSATDDGLLIDGVVDLMAYESTDPVSGVTVTFSDFSQVPIPSTLLLLGSGLMGLGLPRIRRRIKKG
jgi:hypothetical protein